MKTIFSLAVILGLISPVMAQVKSKPLVFIHVTVIDAVAGADPQSDMVVVVADGKIAGIGKFGKVKIPKNSQVIDANGKFLIPG
ncbi:MAG: amidohydrolase, partial [Pyrinomonadaceae bacterium]|nr:amidohydrolase [Pyrinomonadaceae bacterium]